MTERLQNLTDPELEQALVDVGRHLDYAEVHVAAEVAARLRSQANPRPLSRPARLFRPAGRRVTIAAAILGSLLVGTAVAGVLGVPGIGIRRVPDSPLAPTAAPLVGDELFLGQPVDLATARATVDFQIAQPTTPELPPPIVYVAQDPPGGRVSLVYPSGTGLPAVSGTAVGLLITQFKATIDTELLLKKGGADGSVQPVSVAGAEGWWIEGPHVVTYRIPGGGTYTEAVRRAASVLIWARAGVTFRLESSLSRAQALTIAESMHQ